MAGIGMVEGAAAKPLPAPREDNGLHRSQERPNAEAYSSHLVISLNCPVSPVKFVSRAEMQTAISLATPAFVLQANYTKRSSLLLKEYLHFIYPFHNFW